MTDPTDYAMSEIRKIYQRAGERLWENLEEEKKLNRMIEDRKEREEKTLMYSDVIGGDDDNNEV